jgi:SP family arabinose:H+ symporter-like MFS transporter
MLATFIGNFFAGNISDRMGRKKSLILAAALFGFCTLGSALSQHYASFLISRFIGGLGIGISLLVAPMYIAELSPSRKRGFFVSFNQLNIGIGYLVAYASNTFVNNLVSDSELKWRWMLGIGFIFPLAYLIGLMFVPESPAWLSRHGRKEDAQRVVDKTGSDAVLEEAASVAEKVSYGEQWRKLFSSRMRLIIFVAFSIAFFQMACGINAVLFYAPKVFQMAGFTGDNSFVQSNLIGITMVVMTLVSMALIDRLGRKPLLIIGSVIMVVSLAVISVAFYNNISPLLVLLGILGTVVGFSISLGPITWTLLAEIFPYEVKGLGISLAGMFNGIMSFVVTTLFPIEVEYLGSGNTFMIYGVIMLVCLISVLLFYPETKGRKLEEIERELIKDR